MHTHRIAFPSSLIKQRVKRMQVRQAPLLLLLLLLFINYLYFVNICIFLIQIRKKEDRVQDQEILNKISFWLWSFTRWKPLAHKSWRSESESLNKNNKIRSICRQSPLDSHSKCRRFHIHQKTKIINITKQTKMEDVLKQTTGDKDSIIWQCGNCCKIWLQWDHHLTAKSPQRQKKNPLVLCGTANCQWDFRLIKKNKTISQLSV